MILHVYLYLQLCYIHLIALKMCVYSAVCVCVCIYMCDEL